MTQPLTFGGSSAELVVRILDAGRMTQRELAELLGYHRRTVVRWVQRGTTFLPSHYALLAEKVYPRDPALAAMLASRGGTDLVTLGLEKAPEPPPPVTKTRPAPTDAHLADAVVCAAAEAMDASPRLARAGLVAALARAAALGLTGDEVLAALGEGPGAKPRARAKKA